MITVCVLSYMVYCAYTPSNGAMALLNKISVLCIQYQVFSVMYLCAGLDLAFDDDYVDDEIA